jgi:hypothetical protein
MDSDGRTRDEALRDATERLLRTDHSPEVDERVRRCVERTSVVVSGSGEHSDESPMGSETLDDLVARLVRKELTGPRGLPSCERCGAYVMNLDSHVRWHATFPGW